jgi:acyl-CoA thioester hydrolase
MSTALSPTAATAVLHIRVYYEDTDFSGSVYHASYLRFLERGRTELLRARSIDQSALFAGTAAFFVVRAMRLDYLKPARMDDELQIETSVADIGGASLTMQQRILRGQELLLEADVKIAFVAKGRPQRLTAELRAKLGVSKAPST